MMRLWKIVLSVSCGEANGAFARVTDGESFVHVHTHTLADRSGWWAREQKETGCEDTLWLRSFAANINQFRAHPPPLRRLILTWCAREVSNARHRLVEEYVAFLSSHHVATSIFYFLYMFLRLGKLSFYERWNMMRTFGWNSTSEKTSLRSFSQSSIRKSFTLNL